MGLRAARKRTDRSKGPGELSSGADAAGPSPAHRQVLQETEKTPTASTQKQSKKGLLVAIAVGVVLIYLVGFHGEYHSSNYEDGMRYTKTQYFATIKLYEIKGSEPNGLPEKPPSPEAVLGEARSWRGFGLLWQRKMHYR